MKVKDLVDLINGDFTKVNYISHDLAGNALDTFIVRVNDTPKDFLDLNISYIQIGYYLEIALDYSGYFDHYHNCLKE